jgi:hypothetical protein
MTDMFKIPIGRTQMWLARGGIAATILLLMITVILGPGEIHITKDSGSMIYRCALHIFITSIALGLVMCGFVVVYWMQPGWFFKGVSIALLVPAIGIFLTAPSTLRNGLILTPDYFCNRTGFWFSPTETFIEFKSLMYITIAEVEKNDHGRQQYELQCFMKPDGAIINIPVNDPLKKALLDILDMASKHEVVIDENIVVPEN